MSGKFGFQTSQLQVGLCPETQDVTSSNFRLQNIVIRVVERGYYRRPLQVTAYYEVETAHETEFGSEPFLVKRKVRTRLYPTVFPCVL